MNGDREFCCPPRGGRPREVDDEKAKPHAPNVRQSPLRISSCRDREDDNEIADTKHLNNVSCAPTKSSRSNLCSRGIAVLSVGQQRRQPYAAQGLSSKGNMLSSSSSLLPSTPVKAILRDPVEHEGFPTSIMTASTSSTSTEDAFVFVSPETAMSVSESMKSVIESHGEQLDVLEERGFKNRKLNAAVLRTHDYDIDAATRALQKFSKF